jgi:hypothetical protein
MSRPNLPTNVEQPAQFRVQETCYNCHITLADPSDGSLCSCCDALLTAVCRPFFHAAQAEWIAENERRARLKQRLMAGRD